MVLIGILAVFILLIIFGIIGYGFNTMIKAKHGLAINILYGYMLYYSMFEVVYLMCLAIHNSLNLLLIVWLIVVGVMLAVSWIAAKKHIYMAAGNLISAVMREWKAICVTGVVTIGFLILYICSVTNTLEGPYAYCAVSDGANSGKLFLRNMYTGEGITRPDMTYALSGYYMHSAMLCRLLRADAVIVQHNIMGTICILMSLDILYLIGRAMFGNSSKRVWSVIVFYEIINAYLLLYSNKRYFLLTGAYDEMAQLPYILVPIIILGYMYILRTKAENDGWRLMALCAASSCAVSISSIAAVPLMILCGAVTVMISRRDYRTIIRGVLCILPSIVYNVIYHI